MPILYTPGQLRTALGLPQQTYRHWKKALPPLRRQGGHSPCFSAGDLLAVAVVHNLTGAFGVRVGAISSLAQALFEACNSEPWPVLERGKLVIDLANRSLQFLLESDDVVWQTTVLVIPLEPAVARLRSTLLPERRRERQQPLRLPPTPLRSRKKAASTGTHS